jgi:hypothetical protein
MIKTRIFTYKLLTFGQKIEIRFPEEATHLQPKKKAPY